jgi:cytochrome c biogenesis protein CcdA
VRHTEVEISLLEVFDFCLGDLFLFFVLGFLLFFLFAFITAVRIRSLIIIIRVLIIIISISLLFDVFLEFRRRIDPSHD